MLTNFLKFLKGYVVIRLSGYSPERFLNLCSRHHIILWGLRPAGTDYEMCISIGSFKKLKPLVRKTRTKVVILERHGLPFILHRYQDRKLFAGGALLGAVLLYVLSMFIWNIHVEGNYSLSDEVILKYLESVQVVHGMAKQNVHGEEIEAGLREHFPEITWTSAEVKGTRLIIHIQENEDTAPEEIPKEEPADLRASCEGTIVSMIVRKGTPAVSEGTEVQPGDMLVMSRVDIYDDAGETANTYYVHADADVVVRRTEHYKASFDMNYVKKVYTGRTRTSYYLTAGRKRFDFRLWQKDAYEQSDLLASELPLRITENFYLPVILGKNTEQEYVPSDAVYTKEEAKARANEEWALFFEKLRIKGLQIIENNVKIDISGETCTAEGDYVVEESAVRESAPEMTQPEETDPEEEEE